MVIDQHKGLNMLSVLEDTVWLVSIYFKCKHKRRSIAIGLFFISCGNASIFFPSPDQPFNHIALTISDLVKPGHLIRNTPARFFQSAMSGWFPPLPSSFWMA